MWSRFQSTLIAIAMLLASSANAQVFRVQGGTSSLLNGEGGSVEFKAPNYDGSVGLGFFNAASSDDPVGIFFYERKLSKELKFFSRDVVSNRQTLLQGLEYHPNKWLKASLTGGVGANQGYFASGMEAETEKLAIKTSYVITGDMFRRVTVISPMSSEVNKENVQMLYRLTEFVSITTGRENILEPLTPGGPMQQASVNQISSDFHIQR